MNATRQAEALRQAVAQATPTPTANPGRTIAIAIGSMLVVGTCVAGIIADEADSPAPPAQFRGVEPARQQVEPIPQGDPLLAIEPSPEPVPPVEAVDPPAPEPAVAGVLKYEGKITGPTSFAGLALDQTCEVWVEPNVGGLNCRWYIDCGKPRRRIYGGGTAGYSTCTVDETGRVVFAQDEEDDASDGAFLANLNATDPMIVVMDRWLQPPVHVIISVDAGTFGLGPIPDVPLAPRVEDDAIQAQINEGVFPTIEPGKLADW